MTVRFFLICIILIFSCSGFIKPEQEKIYFFIEQGNKYNEKFLHESTGIKKAYIIYQRNIVLKNNDTKLDSIELYNSISKEIPQQENGIVILDWEVNRKLIDNSVEGKLAILNEFIKAITMAKHLRPNMKWGFYNFPLNIINLQENKSVLTLKAIEFIKKCDIIAPSAYLNSINLNNNEKYKIKRRIENALKLSAIYNKEVIPFVWNRVHPNNNVDGLKLISIIDFRKHIDFLFKIVYESSHISGIFWWNVPSYYIRKNKNKNFIKEYSSVSDTAKYDYEILKKYWAAITN